MNIGLFIHPCEPEKPGGLGRANFALAEALLREDPRNTYTVYLKGTPRETLFSTHPNVETVFIGNGPLWLTGARTLDPTLDAYVFFTPIIPLFSRPKKSIVITHDFAFLDIPPRSLRERLTNWFLYMLQERSLRRATRIVAISDATRTNAIRHFSIAPEKIETIHIGYMPLPASTQALPVPDKFFLFAGVLKERKNVAGVIRAFASFYPTHPDFSLVIAGKKEGAYYKSLVSLANKLGVTSRVHFVGYVSNEELAYLYTKATALVFPSFIEGFGMPVLEAMHANLPVITTNTGALAEVTGDAALLVDPHDPSDIAQALSTIVRDKVLRDSLRARGHARAAQFSWERAARALLARMNSL